MEPVETWMVLCPIPVVPSLLLFIYRLRVYNNKLVSLWLSDGLDIDS